MSNFQWKITLQLVTFLTTQTAEKVSTSLLFFKCEDRRYKRFHRERIWTWTVSYTFENGKKSRSNLLFFLNQWFFFIAPDLWLALIVTFFIGSKKY